MDTRLILEKIKKKYEKKISEKIFSECPDEKIDLLGIISIKEKNVFLTDQSNNTRKMLWDENTRPIFLCSGLVMRIFGKKQIDFGKPTNIIVSGYEFPLPICPRNHFVESSIAICHSLNSNDKIDQIVKKVDVSDIFVMGANVDKKLIDVINHLISIPQKKFHVMPGSEDLVSSNLPLSFLGFKNHRNILFEEIPHQEQGVLFLNKKKHLEKMINNSNLKISLIEMMELICDSGQVFPSGRVTRRKEIVHDATYLICDGDQLIVKKYKKYVLIVLPREKVLILEQNAHRFIDL